MKLLFIKIGKAWGALRREGLVHGGRRILRAFLAQFRRVEPGDILFIASGVGDSARYRTTHVAEELTLHGFKTAVTIPDNPFLPTYTDKFQVFVFHRVLEVPAIQKFITGLKEGNKTIIFETDDLVFDPKYLFHMKYFQDLNLLEKELYKNGVGGGLFNDPYVAVATTTTSFLAEKLREKKHVIIVPNRLSQHDVAVAEKLVHTGRPGDGLIRLAYFSGSPTHSEDFATIVPVLTSLLSTHPQTRLMIVGMLELGEEFESVKSQIERLPFASRSQHFANIARADINLAPLVIGDPYPESKSELKFFEAGIVGVPTVAAATQTFREAITDGTDGFVAATTEEWTEKLNRLITDSELRVRLGQAARETALEKYTNANARNETYYAYLRSVLKEKR
ncbi:MAG: glycosyltransferase family 4 protein [Candidatus Moraniibacteriota bacterium]|nr:MAG: glycosyltransferase family 4 protein [Candidatus Moranbacteria bacterium]